MTASEFEQMCFHLLREMHGSSEIKKVEGSAGDDGVDLFKGSLGSEICVWQCKYFVPRFSTQHRRKVLESLDTAMRQVKPRKWILCIPVDMDPRTRRWFQQVKSTHENEVTIGELQGSEIVHQLFYRHNIRRQFFPGVEMKIDEIRALLAGKAVLDEGDLRSLSAANLERYVAKLEERDPRFTYRVTFLQESTSAAQEIRLGNQGSGHMATILEDALRVDVFVRDAEAVAADPPRLNVTVQGTGVDKLIRSMKTGEEIELNSDEVVRLSSNWSLFPTDTKPAKFAIGPPADIGKKAYLLRVSFVLGDKVIVYEAIEFRVRRIGTEEIEVVSSDPDLAFQMSLTFRPGRVGKISIRNEWAGKEIGKVKKACDALFALGEGGQVSFYDLKRGSSWGRGSADSTALLDELRPVRELVEQLFLVSNSFGVQLEYPSDWKREDARTLATLVKIVRIGRLSLGKTTFDCEIRKTNENSDSILQMMKEPRKIRITRESLEPAPILLGRTIDTGPCVIETVATVKEAEKCRETFLHAPEGEAIRLSFESLDEPVLLFVKFMEVSW
jgi:hypothetical protein